MNSAFDSGRLALTHDVLQQYFDCSQSVAAKKLGISCSSLKMACRKLGIKTWPFRKIKLEKKLRLISKFKSSGNPSITRTSDSGGYPGDLRSRDVPCCRDVTRSSSTHRGSGKWNEAAIELDKEKSRGIDRDADDDDNFDGDDEDEDDSHGDSDGDRESADRDSFANGRAPSFCAATASGGGQEWQVAVGGSKSRAGREHAGGSSSIARYGQESSGGGCVETVRGRGRTSYGTRRNGGTVCDGGSTVRPHMRATAAAGGDGSRRRAQVAFAPSWRLVDMSLRQGDREPGEAVCSRMESGELEAAAGRSATSPWWEGGAAARSSRWEPRPAASSGREMSSGWASMEGATAAATRWDGGGAAARSRWRNAPTPAAATPRPEGAGSRASAVSRWDAAAVHVAPPPPLLQPPPPPLLPPPPPQRPPQPPHADPFHGDWPHW